MAAASASKKSEAKNQLTSVLREQNTAKPYPSTIVATAEVDEPFGPASLVNKENNAGTNAKKKPKTGVKRSGTNSNLNQNSEKRVSTRNNPGTDEVPVQQVVKRKKKRSNKKSMIYFCILYLQLYTYN